MMLRSHMAFRFYCWAAALSLVSTGAIGQPTSAPAATNKKPVWALNQGNSRCTVMRETGPQPMTFGMRVIPGALAFDLFILNPEWKKDPLERDDKVDLIFEPTSMRLSGDGANAFMLDGRDHFALFVPGIPLDALNHFNGNRTIRMSAGARHLADVDVAGGSKAVEALHQCIDEQLTAWGADPKLAKTLLREPVGETLRMFTSDDYPQSSLKKESSGEVIITYTIGAQGNVESCQVIGPSGDAALDAQTCKVVTRRGKFEPALGADGKPTKVTRVLPVRWVIPRAK